MKIFKKLFGKKEKIKAEEVQELQKPTVDTGKVCGFCKQSIWGEQKWTKKLGKYYHRRCMKNMFKQANMGFSKV